MIYIFDQIKILILNELNESVCIFFTVLECPAESVREKIEMVKLLTGQKEPKRTCSIKYCQKRFNRLCVFSTNHHRNRLKKLIPFFIRIRIIGEWIRPSRSRVDEIGFEKIN